MLRAVQQRRLASVFCDRAKGRGLYNRLARGCYLQFHHDFRLESRFPRDTFAQVGTCASRAVSVGSAFRPATIDPIHCVVAGTPGDRPGVHGTPRVSSFRLKAGIVSLTKRSILATSTLSRSPAFSVMRN